MSNTATPTRPPPASAPRARMLPLPPDYPAAWACAYGEDRFGLWQAFDVAGVQIGRASCRERVYSSV